MVEKKVAVDIYDAQNSYRQKAIRILESIATYMGDEEMFDCDVKGKEGRWYDLEDIVTNVIEGREV